MADLANNGSIDYLVAMGKGGWTVARSLFGYLQPTGLQETVNVGARSYKGIGQGGSINIYQELSPELEQELSGKSVLVVDDLTDTGHQLQAVEQYLRKLGIDKILSAVLFSKPSSSAEINYWAETTSAWIIFAYESFETKKELDQNWQAKGIPESEIRDRFIAIGFDSEDIDFYWEYRVNND